MMRLFFSTDLHGSTLCFRKFVAAKTFYSVDALVLGGDLTGKGVVPLIDRGSKVEYRLFGRSFEVSQAEAVKAEEAIRNVGFYPIRRFQDEALVDPSSLNDAALSGLIRSQLLTWDRIASEKGVVVHVIPGNDDVADVDDCLRDCVSFRNCDRTTNALSEGWTVTGLGGSNQTPWHTAREYEEEELAERLRGAMQHVEDRRRSIWNIHVPPFGSSLDVCEAIDERYRVITRLGQPELRPVGSMAVDAFIREWQIPLGLFGHVHESPGSVRVGKTLCINPGSEYYVGVLCGCIVEVDSSGVRSFQLTRG